MKIEEEPSNLAGERKSMKLDVRKRKEQEDPSGYSEGEIFYLAVGSMDSQISFWEILAREIEESSVEFTSGLQEVDLSDFGDQRSKSLLHGQKSKPVRKSIVIEKIVQTDKFTPKKMVKISTDAISRLEIIDDKLVASSEDGRVNVWTINLNDKKHQKN